MLDQQIHGVRLLWNGKARLPLDVPRTSTGDTRAPIHSADPALCRRERRYERDQAGYPQRSSN
jgi:hypothetical protein